MTITEYPNGVSSFGMPLIGRTTGSVFFVDDSGSNGNSGADALHPFADIDYAVGQCTANKGDIIFCMPGHTETITGAAAIDLDVAGISLIGLGTGADMSQVKFNHGDAGFVIGAASVTIENMNFQSTITDVLIGVSVEAAMTNFAIRNCRFDVETADTDEFTNAIEIAAGSNGGVIEDCFIDMTLGGADSGIAIMGASSNISVLRNTIIGDYAVACIEGGTAASLILDIGDNRLFNGGGANIGEVACIDLTGNATGVVYRNYLACNLATKALGLVSTHCLLYENYYNEDAAGDKTGGLVGTEQA